MFLRASDTISGAEGKATMNLNGSIQDLFYVKTFEASIEKRKAEVKTLGNRGTGHKTSGWSGSGTMSIYYITSVFRKMALQYIKTGRDVYFDVTVTNEDAGSSVGRQTCVFYGCNLDSTVLAKLDVDADSLDEEVPFTFEDFDILDEFNNPIT